MIFIVLVATGLKGHCPLVVNPLNLPQNPGQHEGHLQQRSHRQRNRRGESQHTQPLRIRLRSEVGFTYAIQGWSKRWALGCVNSRGGVTQPRTHLVDHCCNIVNVTRYCFVTRSHGIHKYTSLCFWKIMCFKVFFLISWLVLM